MLFLLDVHCSPQFMLFLGNVHCSPQFMLFPVNVHSSPQFILGLSIPIQIFIAKFVYGKSPYIVHCCVCVWEIVIHYSLLHLCMGDLYTLFIATFVSGNHTLFIATFVYGKLPYVIHCYICVWEISIRYSLLHLCLGNHTLFIATFVSGKPYIIHCYICVWETIHYSLLHLCMGNHTLFIATFVYGKSSYIKSKVKCVFTFRITAVKAPILCYTAVRSSKL